MKTTEKYFFYFFIFIFILYTIGFIYSYYIMKLNILMSDSLNKEYKDKMYEIYGINTISHYIKTKDSKKIMLAIFIHNLLYIIQTIIYGLLTFGAYSLYNTIQNGILFGYLMSKSCVGGVISIIFQLLEQFYILMVNNMVIFSIFNIFSNEKIESKLIICISIILLFGLAISSFIETQLLLLGGEV